MLNRPARGNLWRFELNYLEREKVYEFFVQGTSDELQKSFRKAVLISALAPPEEVAAAIKEVSDFITRKF